MRPLHEEIRLWPEARETTTIFFAKLRRNPLISLDSRVNEGLDSRSERRLNAG